ncbi:MAG TPA: transketolase [Desulfosarcina sp.]|nr:transketolase [Desulfosarcina sp.]
MRKGHRIDQLAELSRMIRGLVLKATTNAGSGHPTSALSAVELMVALFFGGFFRYDPQRPDHPNNDRILFSKGHASPLIYALWTAAGELAEEDLWSYRKFGSPLEGHPTPAFRHVEAATGSLGQGLSIGVGMAMNARFLDRLAYRTYVLLGDSEMAEGSQWEAIQVAAHYRLDNLVGILDVNRLGQRGETMYGHDVEAYRQRIGAFGWNTIVVDGHSLPEILSAYERATDSRTTPTMIIAKTVKGKGVAFVEDRNGFHGKALGSEDLQRALRGLGEAGPSVKPAIARPENRQPRVREAGRAAAVDYSGQESVATRDAYGNALNRIYTRFPDIVSLDGEVSNSTRAAYFKEKHPDRFFEMFVAEQNMVGVALGLSLRGKIPFVSSFAAFLTRAFDQIRMCRYSDANIKFVGSHAGVSIGEDGPSQMGLEDLAMFRTILDGVVLYPCDAVSTEHLVEEAAGRRGVVYIRTTRNATPVIYPSTEQFAIGGSKVLRRGKNDVATVIAAGATVHEALAAADELEAHGVPIRVVDLYSVKPVDAETLRQASQEAGPLITVEDHYAEGGIADAVREAVAPEGKTVHSLAVRRLPRSGTPQELRVYEEIDKTAIAGAVKALIRA